MADTKNGNGSSKEFRKRIQNIWGDDSGEEKRRGNAKGVGKNYVCSDIQGMFKHYKMAKAKLKPEDTLWVLGDAVNKGDDGIRILQDIMKSSGKNGISPQVNLILGNNEVHMLEWIKAVEKLGLTDDDMLAYCGLYRRGALLFRKWRTAKSEEERAIYEPEKDRCNACMNDILGEGDEKNAEECSEIKYAFSTCMADSTIKEFYKLPKEQQIAIKEFLENCSLLVTLKSGDKRFALVHSMPPNIMPKDSMDMRYRDVKPRRDGDSLIKSMVWGNPNKKENIHRYKEWEERGYLTIHGHSPSYNKIKGFQNLKGNPSEGGSLKVYCIEDGKEFTVDEKGVHYSGVEEYR